MVDLSAAAALRHGWSALLRMSTWLTTFLIAED
jgi:hypothetical protein